MSEIVDQVEESKEQLVSSLRRVVSDAEDLLSATADSTDGKVGVLRERVRDSLLVAREKLHDADSAVRFQARRAAEATDEYVHDNPWSSIGAAAALGLLIGVLLGSRR